MVLGRSTRNATRDVVADGVMYPHFLRSAQGPRRVARLDQATQVDQDILVLGDAPVIFQSLADLV